MTKVFKHGWKSPWVLTLTRPFLKWHLIGHKKYFVFILCLIGEQFLLSSFREFVYDGYLDHGLSGSCTKEMKAVRKLSVLYKTPI